MECTTEFTNFILTCVVAYGFILLYSLYINMRITTRLQDELHSLHETVADYYRNCEYDNEYIDEECNDECDNECNDNEGTEECDEESDETP